VVPRLARRAIEALVALFALLGFCFVPLGEKTALGHLSAMARTEPAAEAARGLLDAARHAKKRLLSELGSADAPRLAPSASPLVRIAPADAGALEPPDASLPYSIAQGTR
jgi:hypothetical protein